MYLLGESLDQYFREVWQFPVLGKEQEQMLAIRLRESGDANAAHSLVTSHLRLVVKIAMKYRGYGLPVSDLISEGNIGLMRAVKKFDPDKGFRLSTYAMWWIKASVTEYVLRSWSLVKMGTMAAQKKLFFSLRKAKRSLNIIDKQGLDEEQARVLGDKYGMSSSEIALMDQRITKRDLSLNTAVSNSEDEGLEFIDLLEDDSKSPEMLVSEAQENDIRNKYLLEAINLINLLRNFFENKEIDQNSEDSNLELLCGLMIEAANSDGDIGAEEIKKIRETLINIFKENPDKVDTVLDQSIKNSNNSKSLYYYSSKINKNYSDEKKILLIEILWEIVLADGQVHDYESSIIRRLSGLLYISDINSGNARKRALSKIS